MPECVNNLLVFDPLTSTFIPMLQMRKLRNLSNLPKTTELKRINNLNAEPLAGSRDLA